MKSAFFVYEVPKTTRKVFGTVTLKDDGKISVSISDGKYFSSATRYQAKMYAESIAKSDFKIGNFSNFKESNNSLIEILRKETEQLRLNFIERTKKYVEIQFNRATSMVKYTMAEWYDQYSIPYTMKKPNYGTTEIPVVDPKFNSDIKEVRKDRDTCLMIVSLGLQKFEAKELKKAQQHYEESLHKLASRIESKGLDMTKLVVQTAYIGININTILTDGTITVKAWTITASGEIQRPHYRYLIK